MHRSRSAKGRVESRQDSLALLIRIQGVAAKLAIRKVVDLKQKAPTTFEMTVKLQDGKAATVEVSTVALADLTQRGTAIFKPDT